MAWDREVDVLVIGTGGSGIMAATRAADLGGDVLIVEKSAAFGGTTAVSGGCLWVPGNHLQDPALGDSSEKARAYLKNLTKGSVTDSMIQTYISESQKMLLYLDQESDLTLSTCPKYCDYYPEVGGGLTGGRTVEAEGYDGESLGEDRKRLRDPQSLTLMFGQISLTAKQAHTLVTGGFRGRILAVMKILGYYLTIFFRRRHGRDRLLTLGQSLVAGMWKLMRKKGAAALFETKVREIIEREGRIVGAVLETGNSTLRVGTRRGIIIASGGFSRAEDIKKTYHNQGPTSAAWGAAIDEDEGDALKFCQSLKPKLAMMDEAWWMPVMTVPGETFARSIVVDRSLPGSIVINQNGQRFVNESTPYEDFVRAMYDNEVCPAWMIADSFHRKNYTFGPLLPGQPRWSWPKGLDDTYIMVAETIEELAEKIQVPKANLVETFAVFNRFAQEGKDPFFHRGDSAYDRYYADPRVGRNPCVRPMLQGPFYAAKLYPGDLGTKGGFAINEHAQVLRDDGSTILGLYAAGNAAANPIGNIYPGAGGTLGPGLTFGYIAAEHILSAH